MQARTQEKIRQAYLDAMGIQTWFPRVELPNAGSTRTFEWLESPPDTGLPVIQPITSHNVTKEEVSTHLEPASAVRPFNAAEILDTVRPPENNEPTAPRIQQEQTATQQVTTATTTVSNFRLVVVPACSNHLVVADMPYTGLNQFTRFHRRLLRDLLKAIGLHAPSDGPVREFVWPLENTSGHFGLLSQISQDDKAAADAVSAFLRNQFGLPRQKAVILLGQAAARFVIDSTRTFEELRGIHSGVNDQQSIAVSHSLNELMKIPHLKAEAWQDLRSLAHR